jgi:hypothetical protein
VIFFLVAIASLMGRPTTAMGGPEFFRPLGEGTVAFGLSGNGTTVVGRRQTDDGLEAFLWRDGEIVGLGDLPGGGFSSSATAASADGSVIVGLGTTEAGTEAFRWTREAGLVSLGPGIASDVSADGSIVVGLDRENEVFWWSTDHGRHPVSFLDPTGEPKMSDDGSVLGGQQSNRAIAYHLGTPGTFPFDNPTVHLTSNPTRDSQLVGVSGDGWPQLGLGTAISSNGRVVAGYHSTQGAWIARIAVPEPSSWLIALSCLLALYARALPSRCSRTMTAMVTLALLLPAASLEASLRRGDVLINDFIDAVVRHYRADGTFAGAFSGTGTAWEGAAVTPDGRVVTTRRTPRQGVNIFDASGTQIASFDTPEVDLPSDVSVFSDGTIAINDQTDEREVVLYRPNGAHVSSYPLPVGAWGSTVGPDDTLWVTWFGGARIAHLARDGTLLGDFALDFQPGDVVVDPADGTLWVSHNNGARVYHLDVDASVLNSFPVDLVGSFNAIALAPDRTLLVTSDNGGSRIFNYSRDGILLGSHPLVSPDGTLFMAVVQVPEPGSAPLAIMGAALLLLIRPRRTRLT